MSDTQGGDAAASPAPKKRTRYRGARRVKNPDNPAHNQFTPKDQLKPFVCSVCGKPPDPRQQGARLCRLHRNEYARNWQRVRAQAKRARRFKEFLTLPWLTGDETTPDDVVKTLRAGGCVVKWHMEKRRWTINGILISNTRLMAVARKAPTLQRRHGWWERRKK